MKRKPASWNTGLLALLLGFAAMLLGRWGMDSLGLLTPAYWSLHSALPAAIGAIAGGMLGTWLFDRKRVAVGEAT